MKNKHYDIQGLYQIIKNAYLAIFPYPYNSNRAAIIESLNNDFNKKHGLPISFILSEDYDINKKLSQFVKATIINEGMLEFSAVLQEGIIKTVSELNSDIENIIEDLEYLHKWLIQEEFIIISEKIQFKPLEYNVSTLFLETNSLPI